MGKTDNLKADTHPYPERLIFLIFSSDQVKNMLLSNFRMHTTLIIMLDFIITSYKLTINVSVTYQECIQYPIDYTYNRL